MDVVGEVWSLRLHGDARKLPYVCTSTHGGLVSPWTVDVGCRITENDPTFTLGGDMTTSSAPVDERLKLAFDQAQAAVAHQDSTLTNLRSRATALVTTSSVVATFAAGLGLIGSDPTKGNVLPTPLALVLVGLVIGVVGCSTLILLPTKGWIFYLDGRLLVEEWIDTAGVSVNEMYRRLAIAVAQHEVINAEKLGRKVVSYRIGIVLLLFQTILLVLGFTVWSDS
ncbi:hypothetical protein [Cellulosimicrobium marinum]|uniref:hypothetical protein n=1 Tax=Cellulosimicrobium marinum TaxID=1638992 RepID=UPI001E4EDFCA|nr:hypothetical protein [Cellulosimicrobium marinum]MCB7135539.1 hypothetical protein [Cellulosimicrobium marinum]